VELCSVTKKLNTNTLECVDTCPPPMLEELGFCETSCSIGMKYNDATKQCLNSCPFPKLNENNICVDSCSAGKVISEEDCLDSCLAGTVLDPTTNKCKLPGSTGNGIASLCPTQCASCIGRTCVSCKNPDFTKYLKSTCR